MSIIFQGRMSTLRKCVSRLAWLSMPSVSALAQCAASGSPDDWSHLATQCRAHLEFSGQRPLHLCRSTWTAHKAKMR